MSKKMKTALLGASHWHLSLYLLGLPESSVVDISDSGVSIATHYAGKYSCPAYQDYRQVVMETKPDFVFTFALHHRMKETTEYLLQLGIPFPVERPVGMNTGEVESLYEFCEEENGFCSIPFIWHYSGTVSDLKDKYLIKPITHMSYRSIAGPPPRYPKTPF